MKTQTKNTMDALKEATMKVLFSEDDYSVLSEGIRELHNIFGNITGITAGNLTNEQMIETKAGIVVTPIHAAHCLLDQMRTKQFLKGVYKAINDLKKTNKPLQILYAGCGPYATLLTPLTSLFTEKEVQFTLLDINEISIDAVQKVYKTLGLESYINEFIITDAVKEDVSFKQSFDIIISETMQAGLRHECQVPLTRNLVKHLSPEGSFIPQNIIIDAFLIGPIPEPTRPLSAEKTHIGTIYSLDFKNVPQPNHEHSFELPETNFEYLKLYTTICLYDDVKLSAYQSGLTMPLTLDRLTASRPKHVLFKYHETDRPCFEFTYDMKA